MIRHGNTFETPASSVLMDHRTFHIILPARARLPSQASCFAAVQVPVDARRALVAALAAVCSTEMCSASCSGGATPQRTAGKAPALRQPVSPGSAAAAAHSELLRLCVLGMGRAGSITGAGNISSKPSSHSGARTSNAGLPSIHGSDPESARAAAQEALSALLVVVEACVGGSAQPLADPAASAFYAALMKALRLLVPEV